MRRPFLLVLLLALVSRTTSGSSMPAAGALASPPPPEPLALAAALSQSSKAGLRGAAWPAPSGQTKPAPDKSAAPGCCAKPEAGADKTAAVKFSDESIYNLDSTWTSDAGRPLKLGTLRGKPQVLAMFFASCEYACPILVHDMQRLESALPPALRDKVGFTLVSFDTERDTPDRLRAFRRDRGLNDRWTLLRGKSDDVLELAALLGIKFKKDARGQFAHSNVILILNAEGEVTHQIAGLNQNVDATVQHLEKLIAAPPATPHVH